MRVFYFSAGITLAKLVRANDPFPFPGHERLLPFVLSASRSKSTCTGAEILILPIFVASSVTET